MLQSLGQTGFAKTNNSLVSKNNQKKPAFGSIEIKGPPEQMRILERKFNDFNSYPDGTSKSMQDTRLGVGISGDTLMINYAPNNKLSRIPRDLGAIQREKEIADALNAQGIEARVPELEPGKNGQPNAVEKLSAELQAAQKQETDDIAQITKSIQQ